MKRTNGQRKQKADLYLIAGLLLVSLAAYAILQFAVKKEGSYAVVRVDGQVVRRLSLKQDTNITVEGYEGGENVIIVDEGSVYMQDADCPDKICVRTGKISRTGETIVCLPHRVVVEITGDEQAVDSMVE